MDSNTKTTEEGFKECRLCGKVKPLSEFYFRKDSKAHRSECKECIKAISRLRVTLNLQQIMITRQVNLEVSFVLIAIVP